MGKTCKKKDRKDEEKENSPYFDLRSAKPLFNKEAARWDENRGA